MRLTPQRCAGRPGGRLCYYGRLGNEDVDACSRSPGGSKYVLSVGSMQASPQAISPFSNYGACISLFAPGLGHHRRAGQRRRGPGHRHVRHLHGLCGRRRRGRAAVGQVPQLTGAAIAQRVLDMAAVGALDLSSCQAQNCTATTKNLLAQTPPPEVLVVNGVDLAFATLEFSASLAYWPQLVSASAMFASCTSSGLSLVNNLFAVVDLSQCAYSAAQALKLTLAAQQDGALGVVLLSESCFASAPPQVDSATPVVVPVACVPSSSPGAPALRHKATVALGLVRAYLNDGPSPWVYTSLGSQALGRFSEWRVEWSGTAMGQAPGAFCVAFTPQVVSGSLSAASVFVTLASSQVYGLTAQASPDATASAYVVRLSAASGTATLFRNAQNAASLPAKLALDGSSAMYMRAGFLRGAAWAVELGLVSGPSTVLSLEDSDPLTTVNYFSFSSSGGAAVPNAVNFLVKAGI